MSEQSVTVAYLKSITFRVLTLDEKLRIKRTGRPTPDLKMMSQCTRSFSSSVYDTHTWICGCEETNSLYCFPCLLFGGEDAWTSKGVNDLKRLEEKSRKHEQSAKHFDNQMSLAVLGTVDIGSLLSSGYQLSVEGHNKKVEENRRALSLTIDCIKLCAIEVASRRHDAFEEAPPSDRIFDQSLIDLVCRNDQNLAEVMKTLISDVPLKTVILNELLDCMLTICREEIKKEIHTAKFLAVIADETTNDANDAGLFQIAIVFRYVVNGQVLERFWGYFIPPGQTAELIAGVIREQLKEVVGDQHEKVIAQSYDGASVMSGIQHRVQAIIREEFKYAYYVHCYAHQLNLVMQRATLHNTEARIFLVILGGIPAFFSRSVERQDALDNIVARSMPRMSGTLWNFNICTVNAVYENLELLSECFHYLYRCPTSSAATVQEAGGLMQTLDDDEFKFWLAVFHRIMPHVDILDRQLQCRTTDAATVEKDVHMFLNAVDCVRSDVNDLAEQYLQKENILSRRTLRQSASQPRHDTLLSAAEEVCDVIKFQATSRFQQTGYLQASQLLLPEKLSTFAREFPENLFTATIDNYPFLLRGQLRTELGVVYRREDFAASGSAVKMLQFLVDTSLTSVFSEVYNVLLIITTTPMSTAEAERCFSTLKRIKTFLRSTVEQERMNAFAMISIEKELMQSITNFNQRVIDLFAQNTETQMDLIYK